MANRNRSSLTLEKQNIFLCSSTRQLSLHPPHFVCENSLLLPSTVAKVNISSHPSPFRLTSTLGRSNPNQPEIHFKELLQHLNPLISYFVHTTQKFPPSIANSFTHNTHIEYNGSSKQRRTIQVLDQLHSLQQQWQSILSPSTFKFHRLTFPRSTLVK